MHGMCGRERRYRAWDVWERRYRAWDVWERRYRAWDGPEQIITV